MAIKANAEFLVPLKLKDEISKGLQKSAQEAAKSSRSFTSLQASVIALNQAFSLAQKLYSAFSGTAHKAISAFAKQEQSVLRVANAMALNNNYTAAGVKSMEKFAAKLQDVTTIGDETTLELSSIALAMGKSVDQTQKLITASADLAAVTGKDVKTAFDALLKAQAGEGAMLKRLIPGLQTFTEQQLKSGAALDIVAAKFKGFAEKSAKSVEGLQLQVKNAFGDMMEELGRFIVVAIDLPSRLEEAKIFFKELGNTIRGLADDLKTVRDAFEQVNWKEIGKSILIVAGAFAAFKLGAFVLQLGLAVKAIGGLSAAIAAMGGMTGILVQLKAFFAGSAFLGAAKAIALASVKFIAIGVVIIGVAAAVDILVRNLDKLPVIFKIIKTAFSILKNGLITGVATIGLVWLSTFKNILTLMAELPGVGSLAQSALEKIESGMVSLGGVLNEQIDEINEGIDGIGSLSDGLDLGFAGQAMDFFRNMMNGAVDESEELAKNVGDVGPGLDEAAEASKKFLDLMKQINGENLNLTQQIVAEGQSQIQQLETQHKFDMLRLDARIAEIQYLKEIGDLTQQEADKAVASLETQRDLMDALLKKKKESAGQKLFSADDVGEVGSNLGGAAGGMAAAASSMAAVPLAIINAANIVLDAIQKLINIIPELLNKLAGVLNSLADLPIKLMEAIVNVFDGFKNLLLNFLPNLVKMVEGIFEGLVDLLFTFPDMMIDMIMNTLPEMISRLLDRLPDLLQKIAIGLVAAMPMIALAFSMTLIENGPAIAWAMIKIMVFEIPKAIVVGLVKGIQKILKMLGDFFSGKGFKLPGSITDLPGKIAGGAKKLGENIAKETSQLFAVREFQQGGTKLAEAVKDPGAMMELIDEKTRGLIQMLLDAWRWLWENILKPFVDGLTAAWRWVWEKIIQPLVGIVQRAFQWVVDKILKPLAGFVQKAFQWVIDNILEPLFGIVTKAFKWVVEKVVDPLINGVAKAWTWVKENVVDKIASAGKSLAQPLLDAFSTIGTFFSSLGDAFSNLFKMDFDGFKKSLKEAFTAAGNVVAGIIKAPFNLFIDMLNKLKIGPLNWGISAGKLGSWSGTLIPEIDLIPGTIEHFQQGGLIGADNTVFSGPDSQLIAAQPGEFVFNKDAVSRLGLGNLERMNAGGGMMESQGLTIGAINVYPQTATSEADIKTKIVPAVKSAIKRASQDGEFVISSRGLRTT